MAAVLTAVHGIMAVLFLIPKMNERAKTWDWAWQPVGDWKPVVVVIPFLVALAATLASFRSRRIPLGVINLLATAAWGILLVVQLLSRSVA